MQCEWRSTSNWQPDALLPMGRSNFLSARSAIEVEFPPSLPIPRHVTDLQKQSSDLRRATTDAARYCHLEDPDIASGATLHRLQHLIRACHSCASARHFPVMSVTDATAEVFVTAFKALKRREREAVLERLVSDAKLAEDLADTLALEARRHQPHQPLREALKDLKIRV